MIEPRPTSASVAVQRALSLLRHPSNATTGYALGTGDYRPLTLGLNLIDLPWTLHGDTKGSDCAGFVVWCLKLPRHRPGFNHGNPSGIDEYDVQDDLNSGSFLGDAFGEHDVFTVVSDAPQPGDVLAYPTIRLNRLVFIGHTAIVVDTSRVIWSTGWTAYHELDIVQVCGPNGRMPAAVRTDGSVFQRHSEQWPKEHHRAWLLRMVAG
jgi:hypothetical protein